MQWLAQMIQEGGPTMLWIEYLALPGVIIAALHVFRPERWSAWTTAAAIALIVGAGAYGTLDGRSRVDEATTGWTHYTPYSAGDAEDMRAAGYREANRPIQFAGLVAGGLAVLLAIGEVRRRRVTARSGSARSAAGA